ncbi:MAG: Integral rane protein TerC [Pedosphaera sp.]|nr:Integral rane protein TerC [Pedosphaera sp.]
MLALVEITPWHWVGFILCVLVFLALDLGVFHREAHVVKFKEALMWTLIWVTLSLLFAALLVPLRGKKEALEFFTGYFIEVSLSMDNVFVIALIFTYFRVPSEYQHRVLFWGILGALLMRGIMIWLGVALITRFDWLLYFFGGFLVLTGIKMLFAKDGDVDPDKNIIVRTAKRLFPISTDFDGQRFLTRAGGAALGRRMLTPLFLVLLMVETTDLIFAVDSIPAIFGVTRKPFIVFTSNVFAILGLRSLYFVLAGAIGLFRYLKVGLSVVLVFIGVKMLIDPHEHAPRWFQLDIPDSTSLAVVMSIIAAAILVSIIVARREEETRARANKAKQP